MINIYKDKDNVKLNSNIEYKIQCENCDNVYICQTKRYLKERLYEHRTNYKKAPKNHTFLTNYVTDKSYTFDFEKTKNCI